MKNFTRFLSLFLIFTIFGGSLLLGQTYTVTTIAGTGNPGNTNGPGAQASFGYPSGIAVDRSGNIYIADQQNNLIRKINTLGVVSTFAGSGPGNADGLGTAASFGLPAGVAIDDDGYFYVVDRGTGIIRKISPDGLVSTVAGTASSFGFSDGIGAAAIFYGPSGIAVDRAGNMYVADQANHRIRKITPTRVVTTLAGSTQGFQDGIGTAALFSNPSSVVLDGDDNVYVADEGNQRIRKITPAGVVTTVAGGGYGRDNGVATSATFARLTGIAIDGAGNIFVADADNHMIRKISTAGIVTTIAGNGRYDYIDAVGTAASFQVPNGISIDNAGNLYVVERQGCRVRKLTPSCVTPATPTISGSASFCLGGSTVLTSSAPTGNRWSTGETTRSITVNTAGNYTVRVISDVCSSAVSATKTVTVGSSSGFTIPDPAFAAALRNIVPSCMNCNQLDTNCAALNTITRLDIPNAGITNLTGIKYFRNLKGLYASSNAITFLPELPASIENLSLPNNQISSISTLPTGLNSLDVSYNPINSLPSLPASLETLYINGTGISSLSNLPNTLYQLNAAGSGITCIQNVPTGPFPGWRTEGFQTDIQVGLCAPVCNIPSPTIYANGPTYFCPGTTTTIVAPTGYTAYLWSNGEVTITNTLDVSTNATISVQVVSGSCTSPSSNSIRIQVGAEEVPVIFTTQTAPFCEGTEFATLSIVGNATNIRWSNGSVGNSIQVRIGGTYYAQTYNRDCQSLPSNSITVTSYNCGGAMIPDTAFAAALELIIPNAMNGQYIDTSLAEVKNLTYLNVNNSNIRSLEGIGFFTSLKSLFALNNRITWVPTFPASIKQVSMQGNAVTSISSLTEGLESFDISSNPLTSIAAGAFPSTLTALYVLNTPLTSVPTLPNSLFIMNANQSGITCLPNIPAGPFPSWRTQGFVTDINLGLCGATRTYGFEVPDANFAAWLRANYADCMNGNFLDTTCTPVNQANAVNVSGLNISNLNGIQYFRNLLSLNASNNNLTWLPTLPNSLLLLNINNNNFTALPSVPTNIRVINAASNRISSITSFPANLETISLVNNNLTSLPTLPNGLYSILVGMNNITCLPNIPTGPFPSYANGGFTSNPSLPACGSTPAGYVLIPDNNFAAYLRGVIPSCMYGNYLNPDCNNIVDLREIYIVDRSIASIEGIQYLTSVKAVYAGGNLLTTTPAMPASVKNLSLKGNQLTSIGALNAGLESIDVSFNTGLTSVGNVLPHTLQVLYALNTSINSLPLLPNTVYQVSTSGSPIRCLPNIPVGPFPSWWNSGFVSDAGLGLCVPVPPVDLPEGFVTVTDSAFLLILRELQPQCLNGNLLDTNCAGLCNINTLNIEGRGVANIDALQYLKCLKSFYASNNNIASYIKLPASLLSLSLKDNPLDSVHSLPANLESLDISETNVRNLPSTLPALQTLYVRNCVDMQSLPTLPNSLYYLEANGSSVQCISHYPIGPFPSWYTGVFVNDNALPLCSDLLGGLSSASSFESADELNMNTSAFEQESGLTIYPNPATNQVNLQAGSLTEAGTVTLLNAVGQQVAMKNIAFGATVSFNLEGLNRGIYFVRYTLPTSTKVIQLIVK